MFERSTGRSLIQRGSLDVDKDILLVEEYYDTDDHHIFFRHSWVERRSFVMYVSWDFPVSFIVHNTEDGKYVVCRDIDDDYDYGPWEDRVFDSMEDLNAAFHRGEFLLI